MLAHKAQCAKKTQSCESYGTKQRRLRMGEKKLVVQFEEQEDDAKPEEDGKMDVDEDTVAKR